MSDDSIQQPPQDDDDDDGDFPHAHLDGPFGSMVMPIPPEIARRIKHQHDMMSMEHDAEAHSRLDYIESLPVEVMRFLAQSFSSLTMMTAPTQDATASYTEGFYRGILWAKFNICPECGINHHDALGLEEVANTVKPPHLGADE